VVKAVADEGVMFAGPTVWQGRTAMRISVSGYATTEDDIEESVQAILRAAG
jgi:aromatic-L-amino-acid decarboxylase